MVCSEIAGQFLVRMWSIVISGRTREFAGKLGSCAGVLARVSITITGRAANTTPSAPRGPKRSPAESARTHTVHSLIRADDAGVRSCRGHIDRRRETSQQRYAGIGEFLRQGVSATEFFKNFRPQRVGAGGGAVRDALNDAGVTPADVDGMVTFTMDSNTEIAVARATGIGDLRIVCRRRPRRWR